MHVNVDSHIATSYSCRRTCFTVMPIKEFTLQKSVYVQHLYTLNSHEWYKLKIYSLLESY